MNPYLDEIKGKEFPVLNDGHLILIDAMGSDQSVVDAARVTRGSSARRVHEDKGLLRYLFRHRHTTPFEMAEILLRVRVPMDCWRQWIRHRTASVNEYSTRYAEAIDSAQRTSPEQWRLQSTTNKQGSEEGSLEWPRKLDYADAKENWTSPESYLSYVEHEFQRGAREVYEERLKFGVAKEQARKDLPLSTYTEAYWKCDLKNLLHFLGLRMDAHAQHEIRQYANIIGKEIVAKLFPWTWEAFLDYQFNAMTLSGPEIEILKHILGDSQDIEKIVGESFHGDRERNEFRSKLARLGI
jgi:thymidylate synthase (FAD)